MPRNFPIDEGSPINFRTYASTAKLEYLDPPGCNIRGGSEGSTKVVYQLILPENRPPVIGHAALEIARFCSPLALPKVGDFLRFVWTDSSNVTHTWKSGSLCALDFLCFAPNGNLLSRVWEIEVTYRAPKWGMDEVPGRAHLPPHERYAEYRWDYVDSTREVTQGYKVSDVPNDPDDEDAGTSKVPSSTLSQIVNTAGAPAGKWALPQKSTVLRIQWSDRDQFRSKFILDYYDGTINSDTVKIGQAIYGPYILRFLDVEQWYSGEYQGFPYWRCEVRILVARDRTENFETFPSMGRTELVNGELKPILKDGIPVPGDQPLDENGKWISGGESSAQDPAQVEYSLFKPTPYNNTFITDLPFRAALSGLRTGSNGRRGIR